MAGSGLEGRTSRDRWAIRTCDAPPVLPNVMANAETTGEQDHGGVRMRMRDTIAGRWLPPAAVVLCVSAIAVGSEHVSAAAGAILRMIAGVGCSALLLLGARHHRCRPRWAWIVLSAGIGGWVLGDVLWDL